jgi:hypothetical protein
MIVMAGFSNAHVVGCCLVVIAAVLLGLLIYYESKLLEQFFDEEVLQNLGLAVAITGVAWATWYIWTGRYAKRRETGKE